MPKGKCLFREVDLRRAVKAAESAGLKIARVDIDSTGKISVIPGDRREAEVAQATESPLDGWMASHARSA